MPVFVRDVYRFVTGLRKATTQGRNESELPVWLCSNFTKRFWGEIELCYDIILWFTQKFGTAPENISLNGKMLLFLCYIIGRIGQVGRREDRKMRKEEKVRDISDLP